MTFHVLLQLTITLTLLSIIYRFTKSQQRRFQASKLSCGLIPSVPKPWWDLIGWRLVKYTLKARDEYKTIPRISDIFQQETQRLRRPVSTMLVQSIAGDAILTFSPDNLKAALATQVSDYEIGDDRVAVFSTLLGTGIVSCGEIALSHTS